jgi:methylphosphotriester-DNA--protein-cysteine methyltransferase
VSGQHRQEDQNLARQAGMSASSFHQWFRSITGMSALQYQSTNGSMSRQSAAAWAM